MNTKQIEGFMDGLKRAGFSPDDMACLASMIAKNVGALKEKEKESTQLIDGMTNFSGITNMYIGKEWMADDSGIYYTGEKGKTIRVCDTPVLVSAIINSIDTGKKRYQLSYKDDDEIWKTITTDGETLLNSRNVMSLANGYLTISSDTARAVSAYFRSCITESKNRHALKTVMASGQFGWFGGKFLPYDCDELIFDGEENFPGILNALEEHGDRDKWYGEFKKLRGREAVDFMTAGALSAPLIKLIGTDGFVCDLYGKSGTGKTITNTIVSSIWGESSTIINSPYTTQVGTENRMAILNNIPYFLEDMNNIPQKERAEYLQRMVMQISNGVGKVRGKKDGGTQTLKKWNTTGILTSEFGITNQFKNAGAYNRVISCSITSPIYSREEIQTIPLLFKENYGFAGRDYIKAVETLGRKEIKRIFDSFHAKIQKLAEIRGKSDRQCMILAYMMTADKIATDYVFKDGKYLNLNKAIEWLTDDDEVDTSARFYGTLMDTIIANGQHFEGLAFTEADINDAEKNNRPIRMNAEYWGRYDSEKGYVYVHPLFLKKLAANESADLGLFYQYCLSNGLMEKNKNGEKATAYHSIILKNANGTNKTVKGWKIKLPNAEEVAETDMTPEERIDAKIMREKQPSQDNQLDKNKNSDETLKRGDKDELVPIPSKDELPSFMW